MEDGRKSCVIPDSKFIMFKCMLWLLPASIPTFIKLNMIVPLILQFTLASLGVDSTCIIRVNCLTNLYIHSGSVFQVEWSPDYETVLASSADDKRLMIWDLYRYVMLYTATTINIF